MRRSPSTLLIGAGAAAAVVAAGCTSADETSEATPTPTSSETTTTAAETTTTKATSKSTGAPTVAPPSGATELSSNDISGGTFARYSTSDSASNVISYYEGQFNGDGWSVTSSGGGAVSEGGGAGISAEKSGEYADVDAGGGGGSLTYFEACFSTDKSAADNCDDQAEDSQSDTGGS